LEFSFPQCESFTPQWGLQSDFCYSLIRVVSCSRCVSFVFPNSESCPAHAFFFFYYPQQESC
jgi:hypothetical protein